MILSGPQNDLNFIRLCHIVSLIQLWSDLDQNHELEQSLPDDLLAKSYRQY